MAARPDRRNCVVSVHGDDSSYVVFFLLCVGSRLGGHHIINASLGIPNIYISYMFVSSIIPASAPRKTPRRTQDRLRTVVRRKASLPMLIRHSLIKAVWASVAASVRPSTKAHRMADRRTVVRPAARWAVSVRWAAACRTDRPLTLAVVRRAAPVALAVAAVRGPAVRVDRAVRAAWAADR